MATKEQLGQSNKKRKSVATALKGGEKQSPHPTKKPKHASSRNPMSLQAKGSKKPLKHFSSKPPAKGASQEKSNAPVQEKKEPESKRDSRSVSKEKAEARKKKGKPHYSLKKELATLWEKMRRRNIAKEERSKLISEALRKMNGKIAEIASSHVSSRVLQTCIKYCSQAEKDTVFEELRPHFLTLSCNAYGVHLVKKMLDNASKKQLDDFYLSLHGHVASLLRHMVGSVVVEHAFQLGNGSQKQSLLSELYSTELQLFKDLTLNNEGRLVDIIPKLGLQKSSVLQHMASVIQPILEKGIVDHSIIHATLVEYFSIADKSSAADVIQQLSGPLLVRMIHTRDGANVGILCIKHGGAKERKKIVKGMKGHVGKIAQDQYGSLVLASILSVVDDTKLLTKIIIRELQAILKELVFDKNGRRPLLQLFHPQCPRYFSPTDLFLLNSSVPSLCTQGIGSEFEAIPDRETLPSEVNECHDRSSENDVTETNTDNTTSKKSIQLTQGGKKDDVIRRCELLVDSGLAENLIVTCIESIGELLRSNIGKEVIYEVVTGGTDTILCQKMSDKLDDLLKAIASLAALPRTEESGEEHVFENFHSSRTIRKLILDCPAFAIALWKSALEGKCNMWVQGHSCKVVSAFLESSDSMVRSLAKTELQNLINSGVLKAPESKHLEKDG